MIVFNLNCCDCDYSFEGWFENSQEYSKQKKKNLITCPSCESIKIKKGLMTPNLTKKSNSKKSQKKQLHQIYLRSEKLLRKILTMLVTNLLKRLKKLNMVKQKIDLYMVKLP